MEDLIISETNKIFSKAIERQAKKSGMDPLDASILLKLDAEGEVEYWMCENHTPVEKVGILHVLGVKIDLRMYSVIVPPQIKKILEVFETECGSKDVEVMVYLNREQLWQSEEDAEEDLAYLLFVEGGRRKKFKLEQVLNLQMT